MPVESGANPAEGSSVVDPADLSDRARPDVEAPTDFHARLKAVEERVSDTRTPLDAQPAPSLDDTSRNWIARTIIWVFVGAIVGGDLILVLQGWQSGTWLQAAAQAVDLIKSAVLPVVTLVLGYYFGRSGKG